MLLLLVSQKIIGSGQQHSTSEQPQDGSLPVNQLIMIAAAQPTPAFTSIAFDGQFKAQAPHSMQESLSVMNAFLSVMSKTP